MPAFQYHPEILERFPDIVGGIILGEGLSNGPAPDSLRELYLAEQRAVLARIGDTPLSEIESLAAWRGVFRGFGANPTKYRSAVEALLRRLTKKGDIPSINTLVDLCNLVSIRYAIPVAGLDRRDIQGAVTVHFADGSERFTPLGESEVEHPQPGEVVFSDKTGMVVARRWCWRQSDESAAGPGTTGVIFTLEAFHAGGREDVEGAMGDLLALLREYAGGEYTSGVLDMDRGAI
jgi:DNA/RNA-binding domain of Phe-tRNA-synthetase-like protein